MDNQENTKTYSLEEVNNMMFAAFAKMAKQPLKDLSKNTSSSLSFKKFSKEKIIEYLQSPQRNEKNIRDASIYMANNSSHYRRLISYYALMPVWAYIITPSKFDDSKNKAEAYKKQYMKVSQTLENMQLKHEFQKIATVAFREDVFYGVCWETTDSFFIQKIDADWCELSSIEDGVYNFAVDMSKIKEEDLTLYPPEFTTMYNEYKRDGLKRKEVPSKISACFKVNEDLPYPLPIFSGTMVSLHDIEDYKALVKQRTEVGNYKLINMQLPMDKEGNLQMLWDDALKYYKILLEVVPDGVGLGMSPTKLDSLTFDKSGGLADTDEVYKSEEQFWSASGTSPLLFGSGNKNSSSALKLSIKSDEELVFGFMEQCQRWLNRRLKLISGSAKFKVTILPVTVYNREEMAKFYKEASSLGLPMKSAYCAAIGLQSTDIAAMCSLENDVLDIPNKFIPLSSSYTQSADGSGRPTNESNGKGLEDTGQQTADTGQNENR